MSLILAWAFGIDVLLSQKTMLFMQMRQPQQCNILSPPLPRTDWQLRPGKLASYFASGIIPSIGNQKPQQQNDHKWISAVNIQEMIPSHGGWLEAQGLYSLYY